MKKIIIFTLFIQILFFSCKKEKIEQNIFYELDTLLKSEPWGMNSVKKAKILEKIYNKNYKNIDFEEKLFQYLDNSDKCYYIGYFLDDEYFTTINNYELSIKILKRGLEKTNDQYEQTPIMWVIGRKMYHKGNKKEALNYLIPAYKISLKKPELTPAWDNEKEMEEIYDFIKKEIKQ